MFVMTLRRVANVLHAIHGAFDGGDFVLEHLNLLPEPAILHLELFVFGYFADHAPVVIEHDDPKEDRERDTDRRSPHDPRWEHQAFHIRGFLGNEHDGVILIRIHNFLCVLRTLGQNSLCVLHTLGHRISMITEGNVVVAAVFVRAFDQFLNGGLHILVVLPLDSVRGVLSLVRRRSHE